MSPRIALHVGIPKNRYLCLEAVLPRWVCGECGTAQQVRARAGRLDRE